MAALADLSIRRRVPPRVVAHSAGGDEVDVLVEGDSYGSLPMTACALETGGEKRQPSECAKPLTSRMLAANTSGIAAASRRSPPWQVPATTRPTVGTPALSSLR